MTTQPHQMIDLSLNADLAQSQSVQNLGAIPQQHLDQQQPIIPSPPESCLRSPGFQCLTLEFISGAQVLLPTEYLMEIIGIRSNRIVPVAEVPIQVMGVCNYRGQVLWLLDLGYLLRQVPLFAPGYRAGDYHVAIVQLQGQLLGLVVHQIQQILPYDPLKLLNPDGLRLSPYIQGRWQTDAGEILDVLDPLAIIHRLKSQN